MSWRIKAPLACLSWGIVLLPLEGVLDEWLTILAFSIVAFILGYEVATEKQKGDK